MSANSRSLLFASYHCLVDPSSGAAVATRDVLELLAGCGWRTRAFCGPALDFEQAVELPGLLGEQGIALERRECGQGPAPFALFHVRLGNTPTTIYEPARRAAGEPGREEGAAYLALLERVLERERPEVMLTYGGQWVAREAMRLARSRGVKVAFALHNFAYHDRSLFEPAHAVLVPSRFSAEHYRRHLGLECTAIPNPVNGDRVRCEADPKRRFVTFVNPQPGKGVFVFARIAWELARRRLEIPLLVVEGRGRAKDWLERTGLDLSGLRNLHRMANTPDPRHFYRVTRILLMPSLGEEAFGLVAAEAMVNGIPVVASTRGALPEVVGEGGVLLDLPAHRAPNMATAPTAEEVAPWVEAIQRLWEDEDYYRQVSQRAQAAAQAWLPDRLAVRYDAFFRNLGRR